MSISNFRSLLVMRHLRRPSYCISKATIQTSPVTLLFAPAALGIDNYTQSRQRVGVQFTSLKEKFLSKMEEFVKDDPKNMIFTEDLKNMVYLAQPDNLPLVCKMIDKFNTQAAEYRFGSFVFGPVVMRMFHYLDAADEALQTFESTKGTGFFDQLSSYHILLDLLYRHERYDDMLRVFEHVKARQINMTKFPKYPVVLVMAACYKQNTPESLEYACKLLTEINDTGSQLLRRACTFIAGLALNQGAPHIALEVISSQKPHYVTIRNIKAIALADMGRVDDALPVLRAVLDIDVPSQKDKHTFLPETVARVRHAVKESKNKDLARELDSVEKALRERNLIDENTLDELLTQEIQATRSPQSAGQAVLHASYQGPRAARHRRADY